MDNVFGGKSLFEDIFPSTEKYNGKSNTASPPDITAVDSAARLIHQTLELAGIFICPGIRTIDLAESLEKSLKGRGADSGVLLSISPEDTVWHGIPGERKLKSGEIVTVDISCSVRGWWADAARTFPVGIIDEKRKELICAAWKATAKLATTMKPGQIGVESAETVSNVTGRWNVSLISEGAGHGIGRKMHEPPSLTYDGRTHEPLRSGYFYTAEPVLSSGNGKILIADDGSAVTADGEPSAHFEVTLLLIEHGTQILGSPDWIKRQPC
ncbi:MAG: hypothetical protein DRZ90_07190 [Spirochaetes bacterium]|nr:MAG: hypothetical protein DRZ90_07190 [Spirochaetota bacterium]